ncbi:TauD/TfdA family dioxygenase [Actinophytocola sp.]|uniref:TauD/TfdA family dioxygenase n=1 Tax=Actinophytocola sp. TaxID=1872138 RepID=UPI002DDDA3ED|nr:TauD/TfdA family dioxygenase [Actinophytocola sp.]
MLLDPLRRHHAEKHAAPAVLAEHGLILLDGIADSADLWRRARSIATIVSHRDSDPDGVTTITDLGSGYLRSGFVGFTSRALNLHTDGSSAAHPPGLLMTSCRQPATTGGECTLADGKAVYDDLADSEPDALRALGAPRSVLFGGATGHLGAIFTDMADGRVALRLRLDDLAQFSPDVSQWLPVLRAAIDRHTVTFTLKAGEGYILDNRRWLHGRQAFTGQRVLHRVLGNPLPHLAIACGFRPLRKVLPNAAA